MPFSLTRAAAFAALVLASAGLIGCQGGKAPPQAPPPPKVTVARPAVYPVQGYYEYNGYVDSVEKFEARARVRGFLNEVTFTEGDEVKAGQLLYQIDPREYLANQAKAKADIEKAKADTENAGAQIRLGKAELARMTRAIESGAAPQTDKDKAVASLAASEAQLDVAKANKSAAEAALQTAELELSYTQIRSPIDGRISRTLVTKGNLVGQNETTLLTSVVSMDPLYVYFDVPEVDPLAAAQQEQQRRPGAAGPAAVPVEVGVTTEEGHPHHGWINFRENRIDTGTGTVRLRARVPNPNPPPLGTVRLAPGQFARVRVPAGPPADRPVIPEDALQTGQEGRFVLVVGADNKVAKRTVKVGPQVYRMPSPDKPSAWQLNNPNPSPPPPAGTPGAGGPPPPTLLQVRSVVAIDEGLKAGDVIVVDGLQKARPGMPVSPEVWDFKAPPAPKYPPRP